jgi:hypothetical protein
VRYDVPCPPEYVFKKRAGRKHIYPFEKMNVGGYFAVPLLGRDPDKLRWAIYIRACKYKQQTKQKQIRFVIEVSKEKEVIEVWRIDDKEPTN